jgi:hypothetical protein
MSQSFTLSGSAHPAPHRERAPSLALAFGLLSAPIAWVVHLLVNYSIAGQSCFGAAEMEGVALSSHDALSTIFVVDLGALALAVSAGYVAFELWKKTKNEKSGDTQELVQAGEGRTRFMAMCGILTSTLFGLAIAVDALGSIVGPSC